MKAALILITASLLASCTMTPQDWHQAAQISGSLSHIYESSEAEKRHRENLNYQAEQQRLSANPRIYPQNSQTCDLNCRQQKHQLQTELLYWQMQNASLKAQGY